VTAGAIASRKRSRRLSMTLRNSGFFVGVVGSLGFLLGIVLFHLTDVVDGSFWITPHADLLALWIGVLGWCFAWYKTRSLHHAVTLPSLLEGNPEPVFVSSLAAAPERRGMFCTLAPDAVALLEDAFILAEQSRHADVTSLHVFAAATSQRDVRLCFARLGVSIGSVVDPIRRKLAVAEKGTTVFREPAERCVREAFLRAIRRGAEQVTVRDCVAACFALDEYVQEVLYAAHGDRDAFENTIAWMDIQEAMRRTYLDFRKKAAFKPTGNMDRAYTAVATPYLDSASDDMTKHAVYGGLDLCIDRKQEIDAIFRAIEGGEQSVVLVGAPGVGKGAIIDGIAQRMVEERVPDCLKDKRLLRLNIAQIMSAQSGNGADERMLYALQEVAMSRNIVLVIENIHDLVGVGGTLDVSSILAGELEKGYTFVLATTTPSEYAERLERSRLGTKLERIVVNEPERNVAIQIVESHLDAIEYKHHVAFTYPAVAACVDLAMRYLHDIALPTSALHVAQEVALVKGKFNTEHRKGNASDILWVTKEDVAACVSEKSHIPVTSMTQDEKDALLQLESRLHERVIGQEQAITAISSALRRARTAMRSMHRPIANFLFLGPTGVGKTELAKTTAEVYFGNEHAMARFDMSEYQDPASITRLIGGNGQAGLLTESIRRTPFSLVLLDELEKAHPDILNLFLQIMDDGRITDGLGRTIDCTNVILIATSNAGTQYIQDEIAKGTALEAVKNGLVEEHLRTVYRPEFLNRFDDIIVFTPLTPDDVAAIAYVMVRGITERLNAKGIMLRIDDDAMHELAQAGYDPKFGARPLRRVLQERVENGVAEKILRGEVGRRDTIVYAKGGAITIEKAKAL
jgi:ATP-dependent Clp protease ATP-binding subunit ClpC